MLIREAASLVVLAEAATWTMTACRPYEVAESLRTPELCPTPDAQSVCESLWSAARADVLARLRVKRRARLVGKPLSLDPRLGRLLVYDPAGYAVDGRAEIASSGFFDFCGLPPWDCWGPDFPMRRSIAVCCWIPEPLAAFAAAGVEANEPWEDSPRRWEGEPPVSWLRFLLSA